MWKHGPQLMALLEALWTDTALLYAVRSLQLGFQNLQLSSTSSLFFFLCVCSWRCDLLPYFFCDLLPSLPIRKNYYSSGNIRQNKLPLPNVTLFIAFFFTVAEKQQIQRKFTFYFKVNEYDRWKLYINMYAYTHIFIYVCVCIIH